MIVLFRVLLSCLLSLPGIPAAIAQPLSPPSPPDQADVEPQVAPDSPRASLGRYLDACRAGQYGEAAKYLFLDDAPAGAGPDLARQLKAVLDQRLWIDLSLVAPGPAGDAADGLADGLDLLGTIPGQGGRPEPVTLVRVSGPEGVRWVFSSRTVASIDGWYASLGGRWVREHLPEMLLRPGPIELLWWQWIMLLPIAALAWLAGRALGALTRRVLSRFASRTKSEWDDRLFAGLAGPLTLGWALVSMGVFMTPLDLYAPADQFLRQGLRALGLGTVFWSLWRVVAVAGAAVRESQWIEQRPSARSMVGLGERLGKAVVAALGMVVALSELGFPVASLLAGLGLGGLAFALAAQKTVENLFGSVSLAADEPFRIGDFVRIDDFVGTVEATGLRSTRIRTLDRTMVSIPNGRLADMRVESYTARDRMRLACTLSLVYATTAAQMREVLAGLEEVLRAHPKIWPDAVVVRFKELGASSLDIEIMAWFQTQDWSDFQLIRQEVLIQFMEVVERAGSDFAFPTRTLYVQGPLGAAH